MTATPSSEGISKIWQFFKSSFVDRPNPEKGASLTAFKEEWSQLDETSKQHIRDGIANGTHNYA